MFQAVRRILAEVLRQGVARDTEGANTRRVVLVRLESRQWPDLAGT